MSLNLWKHQAVLPEPRFYSSGEHMSQFHITHGLSFRHDTTSCKILPREQSSHTELHSISSVTILRRLHPLKSSAASYPPTATHVHYHSLPDQTIAAQQLVAERDKIQKRPSTPRGQRMASQTIGEGIRGRTIQQYPFDTSSSRLDTGLPPGHIVVQILRDMPNILQYSLYGGPWRVGGISKSLAAVGTWGNVWR